MWLFPGFLPHQPFQPQSPSTAGPPAFPPPGPSMPAATLSGPQLPPSSSAAGGLPPMPSPGVPPISFMPPTSSGFAPPRSQPGAPVPVYPGSLHNQGTAPPSVPYVPPGSGYPQGGPGAPAAKPFPAPVVAPPPTGMRSQLHCFLTPFHIFLVMNLKKEITEVSRNVLLVVIYICSAVTPF